MAITWTKIGSRSVQGVTSALTESQPSGNTGDGIDLQGVDSICVSVDAPSGQTFSGGGTLVFDRRSNFLPWKEVDGLTLDLASATGKSSITFAPIPVNHKTGRVAIRPSSVTVSGGTALTITIEASYGAGGDGQ